MLLWLSDISDLGVDRREKEKSEQRRRKPGSEGRKKVQHGGLAGCQGRECATDVPPTTQGGMC